MKNSHRSQSVLKRSSIYIFGYVILISSWSNNLYGSDNTIVETWKITDGLLSLHVQTDVLQAHGLQLSPLRNNASYTQTNPSSFTVHITSGSTIDVVVVGRHFRIVGGDIQFDRPIQLRTKWLHRDLHRLSLNTTPNDESIEFVLMDSNVGKNEGIVFQVANLRFDPVGRALIVDSDTISLTTNLANKINRQSLGQQSLGSVIFRASLERYVDGELIVAPDVSYSQTYQASVAGTIGPDVIVAALPGLTRWGSNYSDICFECLEFPLPGDESGCTAATSAPCMTAYSIATTSCNIGDAPAKWIFETNEHPVIAQNMYRLRQSRFEQIGMSWVKHAFFALAGEICGSCVIPGKECLDTRQSCNVNEDCPGSECFDFFGKELGVGCSDPYTASLNGDQNGLGPRSHINPFTGAFDFPASRPPFSLSDRFARRIQVFNSDLDPNLNAGAQYFAEGHYVTADDAQAGNGTNNISFRPIRIDNLGVEFYRVSTSGSTRVERAAIRAWRENDNSVVETTVLVPNEGRFILAVKAWSLNNGLWRYEYALQNINSDRAAGSFSIPLPVGHVLSNVGFHDVDSHSNEIFDSTDWFATVLSESIVWATTPFIFDENANALRWGTLYNFRFDANVAPQPALITIGFFKPGSPNEVVVSSIGPSTGFVDCNVNGVTDVCDIDCSVPGCFEPCGASSDCNSNNIPDDCEPDCNLNGIADGCDIAGDTSTDCNINLIPDECDLENETSEDCNGNQVPDECETLPDSDLDGVVDCFDLCPNDSGPVGTCVCPDIGECCFGINFCIPDFPRNECLDFGGTPDCESSPCRDGCLFGDFDGDGDVDLRDSLAMIECYSGPFDLPEYVLPSADCLLRYDFDLDQDVDHVDVDEYTRTLTGPSSP